MKIFNWFKRAPKTEPEPVEPVNNRSENLRKAIEKARSKSTEITQYDHPIRPPDILAGVVPENVTAPVLAMDSNPAYQLAGSMYPTGGFVGFPYLAQLATRAEYRAFASAISTEITRKWITFTSTQSDGDDHSEKIKLIEAEFKRLKIRSLIQHVAENDVLFGRGHIAIKLKGHDDTQPLILAPQTIGQGSVDSFSSVEPIWSTPSAYNSIDPTAKDFYKPTSWYVLGKQIHSSRFLTIITRPLPDILKPAFNFAGMSLSQLAEPYVNNWLRTRQSVSDLINNFSLNILATSLDQVLSGGDGADLDNRAQLFILHKSNKGLMVIDKDRESLEQINTPLGGLHELQAQSQEQMCACSKIPSVVLTGISPNGMNASSEGEMQAFNDWIAAQQEAFYRDPLEIVLKVVQLNLFGEIHPEISFKFNPLMEMTAEQQANIRNINAQVAVNYINAGVLAPEEERDRLASDPDSGYQGIEVEVIPEQPEQPEQGEAQPDDIEAALDGWITLNGGSGEDEHGGIPI
jgi:phage-related protein (TIGR01555 family)